MYGIFVLVILIIILAISLGFLIYQNYSPCFKHLNKIPGPPGLPILGNLFQFLVPLDVLFKDDRKNALLYYPIYKQSILYVYAVSIVNPEDVEIILSVTKHNTKSLIYDFLHIWLGTGLLTSADTKWQRRRKILTPAFHFNILQEFVGVFNECTSKLITNLQTQLDKPFIDVIGPVTQLTLSSMAETSMGIKLDQEIKDNRNYKKAVCEFGELVIYRTVRPWLHEDFIFKLSSLGRHTKKVVNTLHTFSTNVITERKKTLNGRLPSQLSYSASKRMAMLDLLIEAQSTGADIDNEGIREEVDTFMFEGHDTTSAAICSVLLVLANEKKVQDEVRQEIIEVLGPSALPKYNDLHQLAYTERCLKECLRMFPSVPFIGRHANEDIATTTGYTIPKGAMINIHIFDMHHNPTLFPDPEKFNPERFLPENIKDRHPFSYIPFSAGPRNCIGQKFAMLELKAVLCGILREFYLEPVDRLEDIVFISDLVLRTLNGIKIKFVKITDRS